MLQGLGYIPDSHLPALDHMDSTKALGIFREIKERAEYLVATLPSQYEYLTSVRYKVEDDLKMPAI